MSNFDPFSFYEEMSSIGHYDFFEDLNGNFTGNSQYTPPPFNGSFADIDFNNPLPSLNMYTPGPERGVFMMGTIPERMIPALSNLMREFQRDSFQRLQGQQTTAMQPYVAPKPENLSESQPSGQLPQYVHGNGASIGASGTVPIYQSSGNSQRYNGYQQTSQYQPPPQFQQQAQYQQAQYQQAQYQQPQYQQPQRQQHARYQFSHQQQQYYEQVNDQQNYRAVQFYSQHITGTALAGNQSYEGYSNGGARTNITTGTTANGGTGTNVTTGINANGGTGTTSNGARAAAYCPMFLEYYPHDPGYPQTSAPAKVLNLCEGIRKIDLKMIAVLHGDNRKTPCLAKCEYCYNGRSRCVKLVVNGKLFEQKKMQCCFCWKQLADWDQYGDHLAKCDSVKKLHVCCLCPFKAETRDELDDHFRNCEGDEI